MCYLSVFFKAFWQGQFLPYVSRKMQKPPLTFEEFLQSQGLVSLSAYYFNYPCVW